MVKLPAKKASTRKAAETKTKSSVIEATCEPEEETSTSNKKKTKEATKNDEIASKFLTECKEAFDTVNLYEVLGIKKETATPADIKKAYYKSSLIYHPDKVRKDTGDETSSTVKFQILGRIYAILTDADKKKYYDDYGLIDGEDESLFSTEKDWESYFKAMFKKVTTEDMDNFFKTYQNSAEEKTELVKLYEKHQGDMDMIMCSMISSDSLADEPRFRGIIQAGIDDGTLTKHTAFVNEKKEKAMKRKAYYEKEAKQATQAKQKMGADETQESLRMAISLNMESRKHKTDELIEHLAQKYAKPERRVRSARSATKAKAKEESDDEDKEKDDENDDDEKQDEEEGKKVIPVPRKASLRKKSFNHASKTSKVKRL